MKEQSRGCDHPRPAFWWWALAVVGGALLAIATLLVFYRAGGLTAVASPMVLPATELRLINGQGAPVSAGLEIRQADPQGWAVVRGSARMAQAAVYRQFSWQVEGLQPGTELRLVWVTVAEPQKSHERVLPAAGPQGGLLDLGTEARWRGRIAAIGLVARGPLAQPLIVRSLELRPVTPTVGALLEELAADWTAFEDWSQRSINYTAGAPLNALFPPVVVVALWIGCGAILYALFALRSGAPNTLLPYAALFLLGWAILDLRWQWDLGQRLQRTATSFAGKTQEERRLAALDGKFYQFLLEVRQRLPRQPVRLAIISADPSGFSAGRARYHLLPHNGYAGFTQLPTLGLVRDGDYVLVLSPLAGVAYNAHQRWLEGGGVKLPAELVYGAAPGGLFRVRG